MPFRQKSKEKGKNPFEASMPLDKPEVKMVEARYNEKPFIIAFGIAKKRDVKGGGGIGTTGVKGEYESQKDLEWQVLYNLKALPEGFMPEEKLKEWMAGTVAVTSGSIDVFSPDTEYKEADEKKLEEAKGLDPLEALFGNMWAVKRKRKKNPE